MITTYGIEPFERTSEVTPFLEDDQGKRSYAPTRWFDGREPMEYAQFAYEQNVGVEDITKVKWPNTAQWK